MRHEPVGLRAVHPFQCLPLLTKRGVKFVVAAALLLHALDEGRESVSSFQEPLFLGGQQAPVMKGLTSSASSGGSRRVMESTLSASSAL